MFTQDFGDYLHGGEEPVYHPLMRLRQVYGMALDWNISGTAGQLVETVNPENPAFDLLRLNDPESFLQCKRDGRVFWRGVIVDESFDGRDGLDGRKQITAVGELSLLADVPCPAYSVALDSRPGASACRQYVEFLLSAANGWWASMGRANWRIRCGIVDDFGVASVRAASDGQADDATVLAELRGYFVESPDPARTALGARMRLRYEDDGVYLDVCSTGNAEAFPESNQPAVLGLNVMSEGFSFARSAVDQSPCVEPLGAPLSETPYQGRLFTAYSQLAARPADWDESWASYSVRRMFEPLTGRPADWAIEDGYRDGEPVGWRRYWGMRLTDARPDGPCCARIGDMWAQFRRLDDPVWGLSSAPDFIAETDPASRLPDGRRAAVFWKALAADPADPAADEGSQFQSVPGDAWTPILRRPADWDASYSSYSLGVVDAGGALRPGHVCRAVCPAVPEGAADASGVLRPGAEVGWTAYSYIVRNPVEPAREALTRANFQRLTGRPLTYWFNGAEYSSWDTGVDPVWKRCVEPASTAHDPVHGTSWTGSWRSVSEVHERLGAAPDDWDTAWASYFTDQGGRDANLLPDPAMCPTAPYFPVPGYVRQGWKPENWDSWWSWENERWKLNHGSYSDYSVFVAPLGEYRGIDAWQPLAARPSDYDRDNFDDIKSTYAVRRGGKFVTLSDLGADAFPPFAANQVFGKWHPEWLAGGFVDFPATVGDVPAGRYAVYAKRAPSFGAAPRWRRRVPPFRDGAFYVERAPEWSDATHSGRVFAQGEERAPDFALASPAYEASAAPSMRLDLRAEWMPDAGLASVPGSRGMAKAGRVVYDEGAVAESGPRARRITFEDARTVEELAARACAELAATSRASASASMRALDRSPEDARHRPRGWPSELDWFRPGVRVRCELPTFGLSAPLLCEAVEGFDMCAPGSAVMRVGSSWAAPLSARATTISSTALRQTGGR